MDAEKLFDAILNTYYSTAPGHDRGKAVALLTHAIEEETQALRAQVAELREVAINAEMDLHGTPDGEALASALARVEAGTGKADGWISVKDRLPNIDDYVLWRYENGFIFEDAIDKDWDQEYMDYFLGGGYGRKKLTGPITHWMPIPDPPAMDTP